ncbi:MAG: BREX system ATP-binding domain-containing protein [Minisyncoccia bacterium]
MAYLIFLLATLILLAGFFVLTQSETRRGMRFFEPQRARLDRNVERAEFILQHVDLGAFLRDELRRLAARVSHDVAHLSLQAVRATERLLTRLVMHLRSRHTVDTAPRENVREFVKTLSDFKSGLKATHPEVGEIQ